MQVLFSILSLKILQFLSLSGFSFTHLNRGVFILLLFTFIVFYSVCLAKHHISIFREKFKKIKCYDKCVNLQNIHFLFETWPYFYKIRKKESCLCGSFWFQVIGMIFENWCAWKHIEWNSVHFLALIYNVMFSTGHLGQFILDPPFRSYCYFTCFFFVFFFYKIKVYK